MDHAEDRAKSLASKLKDDGWTVSITRIEAPAGFYKDGVLMWPESLTVGLLAKRKEHVLRAAWHDHANRNNPKEMFTRFAGGAFRKADEPEVRLDKVTALESLFLTIPGS